MVKSLFRYQVIKVWDVDFIKVNLFIHATRSEWFESAQLELFLYFLLHVCPIRIMVNNTTIISSNFWPLRLKSSLTDFFDFFCLNGKTMVVDSSAEITCFRNVLFWANLTNGKINEVVCATRCVVKDFVDTNRNMAF